MPADDQQGLVLTFPQHTWWKLFFRWTKAPRPGRVLDFLQVFFVDFFFFFSVIYSLCLRVLWEIYLFLSVTVKFPLAIFLQSKWYMQTTENMNLRNLLSMYFHCE